MANPFDALKSRPAPASPSPFSGGVPGAGMRFTSAPKPVAPAKGFGQGQNVFGGKAAGGVPDRRDVADAGEIKRWITLPNGQVIPIKTPSGSQHLLRTKGSSFFFDPKDNHPYKLDARSPSGIKSAFEDVEAMPDGAGRLVKKVAGQTLDVGEDAAFVAKQAAATAKGLAAEEKKAAEAAKKAESEAKKAEAAGLRTAKAEALVTIGSAKEILAENERQLHLESTSSAKRARMIAEDLRSDGYRLDIVDRALEEASDPQIIENLKKEREGLTALMEGKRKQQETFELDAQRAALREEEYLRGQIGLESELNRKKLAVATMTNTGRLPSVESTTGINAPVATTAPAPTAKPEVPLGQAALDAGEDVSAVVRSIYAQQDSQVEAYRQWRDSVKLDGVMIDRANSPDGAFWDGKRWLDVVPGMKLDTAKEVRAVVLPKVEGMTLAGDEVKVGESRIGEVWRDEAGVPSLLMARNAPGVRSSPSLRSGNPYDGVPEYAEVSPQFIDGLQREGAFAQTGEAIPAEMTRKAQEQWAAQRWDDGQVNGLLTEWRSGNDRDRAEIVKRLQPEAAFAEPNNPQSWRLDTRKLYLGGQISLQQARLLEREFYGVQPGIKPLGKAWEEFKSGESETAQRLAGVVGNKLSSRRQIVGALEQASSAFLADYYKANGHRADFDLAEYNQLRESLAAGEAGSAWWTAQVDNALQNAVGSSAGMLVGVGKFFGTLPQAMGGPKVGMTPEEYGLVSDATLYTGAAMRRNLADRGLFTPSTWWEGKEGKAVTQSIDLLFAKIDNESLTETDFDDLAKEIARSSIQQSQRLGTPDEMQTTPEGWELAREDLLNYYDPSSPQSPLAGLLMAYQATRDPAIRAQFEQMVRSSPDEMEFQERTAAYASAEGTISENDFAGPLRLGFRGGQVAPIQESIVEILSDITTAGMGKALATGVRGAKKVQEAGKAMNIAQRAALGLSRMGERFVQMGLREGKPLQNLLVQGAKQAVTSGITEWAEEFVGAWGQTGATLKDAFVQGLQGAIGGLGLAPIMGGAGVAVDAFQQMRTQRAEMKGYADFAAQWTKDHPDDPIDAAGVKQMAGYMPPVFRAENAAAMKAAAEQMEQALVAAQQAAKDGPPSPEVMAPIEEAHAAALDTLKGHAAELRLRTVAAKEAMQEINGIADPTHRAFADAALKARMGQKLAPREVSALLNSVDETGQALAEETEGGWRFTEAGLNALAESAPMTRESFFPAEENEVTPSPERMEANGTPVSTNGTNQTTNGNTPISGQGQAEVSGVPVPVPTPDGAVGDESSPASPTPPPTTATTATAPSPAPTEAEGRTMHYVPVKITLPGGAVKTMDLEQMATSPEEAAQRVAQSPVMQAYQRRGATVEVGNTAPAASPAATETRTETSPQSPAPQPAANARNLPQSAAKGVETNTETALPETDLGREEPAAAIAAALASKQATQKAEVRPWRKVLEGVATMFGHKLVDTGLPFGFVDQWGKFHSFGTQLLDKMNPGSEIGQWIDKVGNAAPELAAKIGQSMTQPFFHRVWFGHDPAANVATIVDRFGWGALPEYAGQLAKDFMTKAGVPLPGTQWLVHSGIVGDETATKWLSLNVGEAFSGGLALLGSWKLMKKARNGQEIHAGWAMAGIAFKLVGGVMQSNPVLLLSGLSDAVVLTLAKPAAVKAAFEQVAERGDQAEETPETATSEPVAVPEEAKVPWAKDLDFLPAARLYPAMQALEPRLRMMAWDSALRLNATLALYAETFPAGIRFSEKREANLWVNRDGTLNINLPFYLRDTAHTTTREAIMAMVEEELAHIAAMRVMTDTEVVDLWNSLPAAMQRQVYKAYHVSDIAHKRVPSEPKGDWGNSAWNYGHEFVRMLVTDREFQGRVAEAVEVDPGFGAKIVAWLKTFIARLRKGIEALPPAQRSAVKEYEYRVRQALREMLKLPPLQKPPAEQTRSTGQRIEKLRAWMRSQPRDASVWAALTDKGDVLSIPGSAATTPWDARKQLASQARLRGQWLAWDAGLAGLNVPWADVNEELESWQSRSAQQLALLADPTIVESLKGVDDTLQMLPMPTEEDFSDIGPPEIEEAQLQRATLPKQMELGLDPIARRRDLRGKRDLLVMRVDGMSDLVDRKVWDTPEQEAKLRKDLARYEALLAKVEGKMLADYGPGEIERKVDKPVDMQNVNPGQGSKPSPEKAGVAEGPKVDTAAAVGGRGEVRSEKSPAAEGKGAGPADAKAAAIAYQEEVLADGQATEAAKEKARKVLAKLRGEAMAEPVAVPKVAEPEAEDQESPFMRERNERIDASKKAGNIHLDEEKRFVENSRGREIYNVHDPKERGIIRTVSNQGEVVVWWSDQYSGEKNLASPKMVKQGKKEIQVLETWLMPSDLIDYVFAGITKQKAEVNKPAEVKQAKTPVVSNDTAPALPETAEKAVEEAPASPPAAPATIGQENINARPSVDWADVSTPGTMSNPNGTLRAAATQSQAPSGVWYYQGDIQQLAFNERATVNGQSGSTPYGQQVLAEAKAAKAAGWTYTNVRSSRMGTVWVFRKGDQVLTRAGAAALASGKMERPDVQPSEAGYQSMIDRFGAYSAKLVEWLQTLKPSTLDSASALSNKLGNGLISKWVRLVPNPYSTGERFSLQFLKEDGATELALFGDTVDRIVEEVARYAAAWRDRTGEGIDPLFRAISYEEQQANVWRKPSETLAALGFPPVGEEAPIAPPPSATPTTRLQDLNAPELLSPAEWLATGRSEEEHRKLIREAMGLGKRRPVNAATVAAYEMTPPALYVRKGEQLVYGPLEAKLEEQKRRQGKSKKGETSPAAEFGSGGVSAVPKPKREKKPTIVQMAEAYFEPGKIVQGYGKTFDRVRAFRLTPDDGYFSVEVEEVRKKGDGWETIGQPRKHRTLPPQKELEKAWALRKAKDALAAETDRVAIEDTEEAQMPSPEKVTRAEWVALQRAERRRLGQPEQGADENKPWAEYEEFHRDAVERAVKAGAEVAPEVLKNYPWLQAEVNIRPYVASLREMPDAKLKAEEKRTTAELNNVHKLLGDRVKFHEVSERFNAVNREIEARKAKNTGDAPETAPVQPTTAPAETPAKAEAKVEEHLQEVKATEGTRPAAEIKAELLATVEALLKETRQRAAAETGNGNLSYEQLVKAGHGDLVDNMSFEKREFQIPGDGTFTMVLNGRNLAELLKRIKSLPVKDTGKVESSRGGAGEGTAASAKDVAAKLYTVAAVRSWVVNAINGDPFAAKVIEAYRKTDNPEGIKVDEIEAEVKALLNGDESAPVKSATPAAAAPTQDLVAGVDAAALASPLMKQWLELRKQLPAEVVLLFRLGDFYEAFGSDAATLSEAAEVSLTKRNGIPMAGIPHHSARSYIAKLVKAGHKVALAEQTEQDPRKWEVGSAEAEPVAESPAPAPEAEPAAPVVENVAKAKKKRAEAAAKIEDFGEKIGGARKDVWGKMRLQLDAELPAENLDITMSKHWPEPNYEALIAQGVDAEGLAAMKALRDMIPTKPQRGYQVQKWAQAVRYAHGLMQEILKNEGQIPAEMRERVLSGSPLIAMQIRLYQQVGFPLVRQLKGWKLEYNTYSYFRGIDLKPGQIVVTASHKGRTAEGLDGKSLFGVAELKDYATWESATDGIIARIKERLESEAAADPEGTKPKSPARPMENYKIYQDRFSREYFIGRRGINGVVRMKAGFTSVAGAREYLVENKDVIEAHWESLKIKPNYRNPINAARQGPARREDEVSPEMFQEAFGFRGVEFGNWVEDKRRQEDLNEAYDALVDLAEVLDVPTQALSLDGSLGLAFGARGHSGAKAHYEPGSVVINLTKESGPGSLAHEWWHGLDNYFARYDQRGETQAVPLDRMITKISGPAKNIRPEVLAAFQRIAAAVGSGPFAERSKKLDDARSKPYYGTTVEKTARAFERYVRDRLAEKLISNDYLVNIGKDESEALPTEEEMRNGIKAAYDALFDALETKETERGQMLFTGNRAAPASPIDTAAQGAATAVGNGLAEPTEAQKEAGNYAKGHVRVGGLDISIENPAGSVRRGTNANGKAWETTMQAHYGYVRGTEGPDGDHLDVFIAPGTPAEFRGTVYVVEQTTADGKAFDEHKAVFGQGIDSPEAAGDLYHANYEADWKGGYAIQAMPWEQFKVWAQSPLAAMPLEGRTLATGNRAAPAASDAEYLAALKAGDMETAQRMVDEAVKVAAQRASVAFDVEDPKLATKYRGMEGYGVWMLPDGRIIPVENHTATAKQFFGTSDSDEAISDAFGSQWAIVRAIKGGDFRWDNNVLNIESGRLLNSIQSKNLKDWAIYHGYEIKKTLGFAGQKPPPVTYDSAGNVIPLSQRFTPSDDIRFSLSPGGMASEEGAAQNAEPSPGGLSEADVQYLAAVEAKDILGIKKMLNQQAQLHGLIPAFVSVVGDVTEFNTDKNAIFLTDTERAADSYASGDYEDRNRINVFIRLGKSQSFDFENNDWQEHPKTGKDTDQLAYQAQKDGFESVVFQNIKDYGNGRLDLPSFTEYVVFSSNQIKSADAITRDNDGNIIPLSRRFDSGPDVRGNVNPESPGAENRAQGDRFSLAPSSQVSAKTDAEYMAAVESGDTETAQRLVDSVRLKPREVFYVGNTEVVRNPNDGDYRQIKREHQKEYPNDKMGETTRFTTDKNGNRYIWRADYGMHSMIEPGIEAREKVAVGQNEFNWNRKSADPVTYDSAGNVIPLSQRFNPQSDSILYTSNRSAPAASYAAAKEEAAKRGAKAAAVKRSSVLTQVAGQRVLFKRDARSFWADVVSGNIDRIDYYAPGFRNIWLDTEREMALARAAVNSLFETLNSRARRGFGYPAWWKSKAVRAKWQEFQNVMLPTAARLEASGVNERGEFEFKDFMMRAGRVPVEVAEKAGLGVGDVMNVDGEALTLGPSFSVRESNATTGKGKLVSYHLLLRPVSAADQQATYRAFVDEWAAFPVAKELLDEFIMPGLDKGRFIGPRQFRTAEFNRYSLRDVYNEWPDALREQFGALPELEFSDGYVPEVPIKSGISAIAGGVFAELLRSYQSPARRFAKQGLRESGDVKNLFEGFQTQLMQAHMEKVRMERRGRLLKAAAVPEAQIPVADRHLWMPVNDAFEMVYEAVVLARNLDRGAFPALTGALNPEQVDLMRSIVGEAWMLRGRAMQIPAAIYNEMLAEVATAQTENLLLKLALWFMQQLNAASLASFQYLAMNFIGNEILKVAFAVQSGYKAMLFAMSGRMEDKARARLALSTARYLMQGAILDRFPLRRERFREILPREIFDTNHFYNALQGMDEGVLDNVKKLQFGSAFLAAVRAGNWDVGAKVQLANAMYQAYAREAWRDAAKRDVSLTRLSKEKKRQWLKDYVATAPATVHREVEMAAGEWLMNYENTPRWMNSGAIKPFIDPTKPGKMSQAVMAAQMKKLAIAAFIPFLRWSYLFVRKVKRTAIDEGVRNIVGATGNTREGIANLMALGTLVAAPAMLTFLKEPGGDDDKWDKVEAQLLGRSRDMEGKDLDRTLKATNRFNVSALARIAYAKLGFMEDYNGEAFTVTDNAGQKADVWLRYRNYPFIKEGIVLGLWLQALRGSQAPVVDDRIKRSTGNAAGNITAKDAFGQSWQALTGEYVSLGLGYTMLESVLAGAMSGSQSADAMNDLRNSTVDLLTSPVLPHRLMRDIGVLVDPTDRRSRPSARLGYDPGWLETFMARIPGLKSKLPLDGEVAAPTILSAKSSVPPAEQAELLKHFDIPATAVTYSKDRPSRDAFLDLRMLKDLGAGPQDVGLSMSKTTKSAPKPLVAFPKPDQVRQRNRWIEALRMTSPINTLPVNQTAYRAAVTATEKKD